MKRALIAVALLIASLASASGQASSKLPFNPWDKAQEGDWEALTVDTNFEGQAAEEAKSRLMQLKLVTFRVRGAGPREVKVGFETVPALGLEEAELATVYSRSETPAFDRLLDVKGDVRDVKMPDEKKTVLGRELACTKVTYTLVTSRGARTENTAWFSKDVKVFGLVGLENVIPFGPGAKITVRYELAGMGAKEKVELGKKPQELAPKK